MNCKLSTSAFKFLSKEGIYIHSIIMKELFEKKFSTNYSTVQLSFSLDLSLEETSKRVIQIYGVDFETLKNYYRILYLLKQLKARYNDLKSIKLNHWN